MTTRKDKAKVLNERPSQKGLRKGQRQKEGPGKNDLVT